MTTTATTYRHPPFYAGAQLEKVTDGRGNICAYMVQDPYGAWYGRDQDGNPRAWGHGRITTCILDGVRLERHGLFEDGKYRFRETGRVYG